MAGEAPSPSILNMFLPKAVQKQIFWVAADAGYLHAAQYGAKVHAVIGDFDSLQSADRKHSLLGKKNLQTVTYPTEKDWSDRDLALQFLAKKQYNQIIQIGGGGGRSDHFLAMVFAYQKKTIPNLPILWLTGHEAIYFLQQGNQLKLEPKKSKSTHRIVSCFPLEENTELSSKGLHYPLTSLLHPPKNTMLDYSLSNWGTENEAILIEVHKGTALVFVPYPSLVF